MKRVSTAFMHCYQTIGPEAFAIAATLKGDVTMEQAQRDLTARYVSAYAEAFAGLTALDATTLQLRFAAIVAAGEELSQHMLTRDVTEEESAETLASLIVA